jgi:hypothetical protein
MEVLTRSGLNEESGTETQVKFVVERASLGKVEERDMKVEFPPETHVVDFVGMIAYRVLPNGGREFLPLGDPRTGKIFDPRNRPLDEALKDADAQQVASRPGAPAPGMQGAAPLPSLGKTAGEEQPPERPWPWGVIAGFAAVLAALAAGWAVLYKRNRAARASSR